MTTRKILIVNTNITVVHDFFGQLGEKYFIVSCSTRKDDIENHIVAVRPDVFVIILGNDVEEDSKEVIALKRILTRETIAVGIFGSPKSCEEFQRITGDLADIVIHRPISIDQVNHRIDEVMEEREFLRKQMDEARKKRETIKVIVPTVPGRKRILVVDDEPIMLRVVKEHLERNYEVATAVSGKVAYKYLENHTVDLILLDYHMPEEDGATVLRNLRHAEETKNIPVIFLTGLADRQKIREVLALNPQGYLLKPVDKEKLLGILDKILGEE